MQIQEKKGKYGLEEEEQMLLIFLEKMGDMSSLLPCKQQIELF